MAEARASTKAVVAIRVLSSPGAWVGAVGLPVRAGDARSALSASAAVVVALSAFVATDADSDDSDPSRDVSRAVTVANAADGVSPSSAWMAPMAVRTAFHSAAVRTADAVVSRGPVPSVPGTNAS